jgi:hypothetical protein
MNATAVGITAGVVGLAAGLAVALPCFLQPNYGIIVQADKSVISDAKWTKIEDVLKRAPVTPGADARNMLYRVRAFDPHLPPSPDVGDLPATLLLGQPDVPATFSGHAYQIGIGALERTQQLPTNGLKMPQAHLRLNLLESKEMVKEVNDVLNGP